MFDDTFKEKDGLKFESLVLLFDLCLLLLDLLRLFSLIVIDLLSLIKLLLCILFLFENGAFGLIEYLPSL